MASITGDQTFSFITIQEIGRNVTGTVIVPIERMGQGSIALRAQGGDARPWVARCTRDVLSVSAGSDLLADMTAALRGRICSITLDGGQTITQQACLDVKQVQLFATAINAGGLLGEFGHAVIVVDVVLLDAPAV